MGHRELMEQQNCTTDFDLQAEAVLNLRRGDFGAVNAPLLALQSRNHFMRQILAVSGGCCGGWTLLGANQAGSRCVSDGLQHTLQGISERRLDGRSLLGSKCV